MAACLRRRIDKSYKTDEFNEETVFGTGRTCMQYLFPSALTAVEISLLTEDAQLSLFQRSFGNTKGCVGFLILLRLCAHVCCLGWARGVFLWLSYQVEHLCWVHDAYGLPAASQWSLLKTARQAQSIPWFLSFSLMNFRFGHEDDLGGEEYNKRSVNHLSLRRAGVHRRQQEWPFFPSFFQSRWCYGCTVKMEAKHTHGRRVELKR